MTKIRDIALTVVLFIAVGILTVCSACSGTNGGKDSTGDRASDISGEGSTQAVVPQDKTALYTLSGTWRSDDEQTVVPLTLHLYEDGTLVLECHENKAGTWEKDAEDKLQITIGGDSYTASYSDNIMGYTVRIRDHIGEEEFSVTLSQPADASRIAERNNQVLIDSIAKTGFTAEGGPGEIIFYGGSNFQKWTTLKEDLEGYPVRNHSIGGSNDPIRRHFIKERVYDLNPAVVFYMSSSNDWTSGQDKDEIIAYKQEMFDEMAEKLPNTVFVILSSTPNPLRYFGVYHSGMTEVDNWTENYCRNKDHFEFLDVVPPLSISDGAEPNPDLWQSDRLHLNREGYDILAGLVRDKIREIAENYGITFASAEEIPEDGDEQKANWTTDWTVFDGWLEEDFSAKTVDYQLSGSWAMEGDYPMVFNLLLNLYSDGSARIYQHSPTRGDNYYFGYWTERDTDSGNRISLSMKCETNGDGLVEHSYTYRFFEGDDGTYRFSYDFGIIPDAYMRAADLTGGRDIVYETSESFAEAADAE